jgi:dihydrofolate synthase/folylpolyglutamate synthase
MDEQEALALLDARARFGMKPGLETIRGMLAALGNPERRLRAIHVAGSNGKGSCCALMAAALQEAGHRTGLYTSPHLVRFHERIRVDGHDIPGEEIARGMERLRPALEAFPEATYFEVATALALQHFAEAGVDVVVLESGLGGRLDATNVFDAPLATLITSISLEHTEVLGATEAAIAREKAGIVKPGVPLVTGATGEALAVIRAVAAERGAPLRVLGEGFVPLPGRATPRGQTLEVDGAREAGEVEIPFVGAHQLENAALAMATLDAVHERGLAVPPEAIRRGFPHARWPGRLQRVAGRPALLLDGAHNPAGMRTLAAYLAAEKLRPVAVFGALSDKDWAQMVEVLAPHVLDAVVTRVPSSRALDPQEAARAFSMNGLFGMVVDDPGHALRTAEGIAGEDGLVLVTGSLYLVGEILRLMEKPELIGGAR